MAMSNIGHSFEGLDEFGDPIPSESTQKLPPSDLTPSDEHYRKFQERYSSFRKNQNPPPSEVIDKIRDDTHQEIDYVVTRALEMQSEKMQSHFMKTPVHEYGFNTSRRLATKAFDSKDSETILAD